MKRIALIALCLVFLLSGCAAAGREPVEVTRIVEEAVIVKETVVVKEAVEVEKEVTRIVEKPVKETVVVMATLEPTITPTPTPTPDIMRTILAEIQLVRIGCCTSSTVTPSLKATVVVTATSTEYGQPPQPQRRHPSLYKETGMGQTREWVIDIDKDKVLIVGGVCVDGICGGVYKAVDGPKKVTVNVTDGFVLVGHRSWARDEFCFRVDQAIEYGWAHEDVQPLSAWSACD